jgi:hypothetical protein
MRLCHIWLCSGKRVDCKRVADTSLDEVIQLIVRGKTDEAGDAPQQAGSL